MSLVVLMSSPAVAVPMADIEKTTNGPTNANPTAPDFDNEDSAGGPGVPLLTPGSSVVWTYRITNTGDVVFQFNQVSIVDDNGTPGNAAADLTTTGGQITFQSVFTGDADNLLEPGEVWLFQASGTVHAGLYENTATLSVPGDTDFDLSHYTTPRAVPQPGALGLLALGAGAALLSLRRRAGLPDEDS